MNVVSICRSRSGLAWASCSDRKRAGSILLGAVIASFLLGSCERSSRRSRGGRLHVRATLVTEPVAHHLGGRHFRFPPEVITLAVLWYLRDGLSYRDAEELLAERGASRSIT